MVPGRRWSAQYFALQYLLRFEGQGCVRHMLPRQHETTHKRAHQSPMMGATRSLQPSKAQHDFGILDGAMEAVGSGSDLGVELNLFVHRSDFRRQRRK